MVIIPPGDIRVGDKRYGPDGIIKLERARLRGCNSVIAWFMFGGISHQLQTGRPVTSPVHCNHSGWCAHPSPHQAPSLYV